MLCHKQGDEIHFRNALVADAHRISKLLQNAMPALKSKDLLCECMGIKKFLIRSYHVVQMKQAHSDVMLLAHRLHQGNNRIEKLLETSKKSS